MPSISVGSFSFGSVCRQARMQKKMIEDTDEGSGLVKSLNGIYLGRPMALTFSKSTKIKFFMV
jgi:hypothetical protein